MTDRLAGKTVKGSFYSGAAAIITFVLGFARLILLTRLLLPEDFGVMALTLFFVGFCGTITRLGLDEAFIHSQDGGESLKATYFSLRVGSSGLVTGSLLILAPILQQLYPNMAQLEAVLIVSSLLVFVDGVTMAQVTFIRKELAFSILAIADIAASLLMTIVAPLSAWQGWGVWALVAENASYTFAQCLFTWSLFRRWRPRFAWNRQAVEFFWRFGRPLWVKTNIEYFLDRFDDFWIGTTLGQNALGYYTKAYDFARAPRRIFANPLLKVFVPVFALLQNNRQSLSQMFFRCAYLLVRCVFFGAGLFVLTMPEFIHLIIGEKWLPMLWTFRLLVVYVVFDSFLLFIKGLFIAVGKPSVLRNITLAQAIFFMPAVMIGVHIAGINGVAIAADGMLLIGGWRMYRPLKKIIDFPAWRLLGWPILAVTTALGGSLCLEAVTTYTSVWQSALLKVGSFSMIFGGILLIVEQKDYIRDVREIWNVLYPDIMKGIRK